MKKSDELFVLRRLACILRNPEVDDDDDDEEQISQQTVAAIEAPSPVEQPPPRYERERY